MNVLKSVSARSSPTSTLLLLSVVVVVFFVVGCVGDRRTHALLQLILLPVTLFLVSRVKIAGVGIPKWVFALAVTGSLLGAALTYTHVDLVRGAFIVVPSRSDANDSDIKIRRDRIRRALGAAGLTLVGSHPREFSSQVDAQGLLHDNDMLGGVVWGSSRWLTVSLRNYQALSLTSLSNQSLAHRYLTEHHLSDLRVIAGVGSIGISDGLDPTTLLFIGKLIPLWRDFPAQLRGESEDDEDFEIRVRSLAGLKANWTSFGHRALPMWMAGTYHLMRAISSPQLERGELLCSISSFHAALTQLRPSDNPELQIAIRNNLALAILFEAYGAQDGQAGARKASKRLLREARNIESLLPPESVANSSAAFNLTSVKGKHGKRQARTRKQHR